MNVALHDAGARLESLIADARRGADVTITDHGVPVARLVPASPAFDKGEVDKAVEGLRALRLKYSLGGLDPKELINEGRR